jgi:hypothetical protein
VLTGERESGEHSSESALGAAYLMRRRRPLAFQDDAFASDNLMLLEEKMTELPEHFSPLLPRNQ